MYYRCQSLIKFPPSSLIYFSRYIDDLIGIWTGTRDEIIPTLEPITNEKRKLTFVSNLRVRIQPDPIANFASLPVFPVLQVMPVLPVANASFENKYKCDRFRGKNPTREIL